MRPLFIAGTFEAISSFWLSVLAFVKVSKIMIKTGTNSNRKGDVFANVFIGLVFIVINLFLRRSDIFVFLMKQIE